VLQGIRPRLSVIVPVHNGRTVLPLCLSALERSDLPRSQWELIVVDDGSNDDSALIAARYADAVVRLPGKRHGHAYSRNRGFEASNSDIAVFIDVDVAVHEDTLGRFLELHEARPDVSAIFGAYDGRPSRQGIVSDFRSMLDHYLHQRDAGEAERFWAGCGSVRADAFRQAGMFDEWHYSVGPGEDIELGRRLRLKGHRILLRPELAVTHLKSWTLRDSIFNDFRHRSLPLMRLRLHERWAARSRAHQRPSERLCTAAAALGWVALFATALLGRLWPLLALPVVVVVIAILNGAFYRLVLRERGVASALAMVPLHALYYATNVVSALIGWVLHHMVGAPLAPIDAAAEAGMDLRVWPPRPSRPEEGVWSHSPKRSSNGKSEPASSPSSN
jgi:glycosyltransferase involved in cell wall biosynthesis